jgi:ABC-type sugar transport system ATPase subunit
VASLQFAGVQKSYGPVRALKDFDLEVADGEILTIVGPSGCGKSSALRVAAGLEGVTAGTVHIGGRDVTRLAPSERDVSMVFQSYALFPHLDVAQNIGFGLAVRKVAKAVAADRVVAAARTVGCADLLDRRPSELSGGERQRVALARALVRDPDVFLLDEPLSNLDAQLRVQMRAELQQLHLAVGLTMVYVTHDQIEALTLGHRVAVMRDGVVQQVAPPDDIFWRPVNRFVATFIGSPSMNLLPATVDGDQLHAGPFTLRLDRSLRLPDVPLELGVRPEHLLLGDHAGGVQAVVRLAEAAGNDTFLHLAVGGLPMIVRTGPEWRPSPGDGVHVALPADRCYLFDARTGETLWPVR